MAIPNLGSPTSNAQDLRKQSLSVFLILQVLNVKAMLYIAVKSAISTCASKSNRPQTSHQIQNECERQIYLCWTLL